jgi:hypothetical protein
VLFRSPALEQIELSARLKKIKFVQTPPSSKKAASHISKNLSKTPQSSPSGSDQVQSGSNSEVESDVDDDDIEDPEEENFLEEEVEEEPIQSQEGQEAPHTSYKKVRKKAETYHISQEDEDSTIQWIKAYPMLYDKHIKDYKKAARKKELWTNKAKELGLTYSQIITWYLSLRTRFGKLVKCKKSGDGARDYTTREEWLITNLDFLNKHIYRHQGRQAKKVSKWYPLLNFV